MRPVWIFLLALACNVCSYGQLWKCDTVLSVSTIDLYDIGESGDSVMWTLPDFEDGVSSDVQVFSLSDTTASVVDGRNLTRYAAHSDSVFVSAYENRLLRIAFALPIFVRKRDFALGDSTATSIAGVGYYCDRLPLSTSGSAYSVVDGHGVLRGAHSVIPDVYRIHHHQEYDTFINKDTASVPIGHTIADVFEWWTSGSDHPEMQASLVRSVSDGTETEVVKHTRVPQREIVAMPDDIESDVPMADIVTCDAVRISSSGDIMLSLQSGMKGRATVSIYDISSQRIGRASIDLCETSQILCVRPSRRPVGGALLIHVTHSDFQQSFNIPISK